MNCGSNKRSTQLLVPPMFHAGCTTDQKAQDPNQESCRPPADEQSSESQTDSIHLPIPNRRSALNSPGSTTTQCRQFPMPSGIQPPLNSVHKYARQKLIPEYQQCVLFDHFD